jgi:hypothetical protein
VSMVISPDSEESFAMLVADLAAVAGGVDECGMLYKKLPARSRIGRAIWIIAALR